MFKNSKFNQDISKWNVSNVTNMNNMFKNCPFNKDISNWCVEKINQEPNNFSSLTEANKPNWGQECITGGGTASGGTASG